MMGICNLLIEDAKSEDHCTKAAHQIQIEDGLFHFMGFSLKAVQLLDGNEVFNQNHRALFLGLSRRKCAFFLPNRKRKRERGRKMSSFPPRNTQTHSAKLVKDFAGHLPAPPLSGRKAIKVNAVCANTGLRYKPEEK